MSLETVEAVGPFGMRAAEPAVHREQAVELKSRRAALAVAGPARETDALQPIGMLVDGRLGQRGGLCDLDDASLPGREALEDRPAGGVGKRREGAAQGVLHIHYPKVILPDGKSQRCVDLPAVTVPSSWWTEPRSQGVTQSRFGAVPHPGDMSVGPDQHGSGSGDRAKYRKFPQPDIFSIDHLDPVRPRCDAEAAG